MNKKHITLLFLGSLVSGAIGVIVLRKSPLSPFFDIVIAFGVIGLIGFLTTISFVWFRKSMIKKILAGLFSVVALLVVVIVLTAMVDIRNLIPKSPSKPLTQTEWMEDFEVLAESMRIHPVYNDSLELIIDSQMVEIKNLAEISDHLALITSLKMVSLLGDAHSHVMPFQLYLKKPKYLPIQSHVFEDGIFITNAANKKLIGGRMISINGHSIESIYKKITPLIGSDNEWGTKHHSSLYINNMDVLKGIGVISTTNEAIIEIKLNGIVTNVELKAVTSIKWAMWALGSSNEIRPVGWNMRTAENKVERKNDTLIWMTFNQTGPEENLTTIGKQIQDKAFGENIKHMVIDLRNNTGGNNYSYNTLLEVLAESPMNITFLTSRKTYSAGTNFISELQLTGKSFQIIGEPTGSGHNLSGDPETIFLPNSGLMVNISTKPWNFIPELKLKTIPPDIMINYMSSDYFNDTDPWLMNLK